MKDELVSGALALLLKDAGFDWECNHYFRILEGLGLRGASLRTSSQYINWNDDKSKANGDEFVSIPTQSLAHRWFREKHHFKIEVLFSGAYDGWTADVWKISKPIREVPSRKEYFKTYEEALEYGLGIAIVEVLPCE